ncbi:lysozyme inhibitor LprI family protein [Candidatus Palauibacter sp.]|uniref:lysozyme inhibitor LprI family protein n=1 Tax=Candidatus Palauibacter sp. TaxID=3101350 RepID=UPI003B59B385
MDFEIVIHLHRKQITIGDVIAHTVRISRVEHIISCMSQLIENDFKDRLAHAHSRFAAELDASVSPLLSDVDETLRCTAEVFRLRHIVCHEIATNVKIEEDTFDTCFDHAVLFLRAAEEVVSSECWPDSPLTQAEMNISSYEDYRKEEEVLAAKLVVLEQLLSTDDEREALATANRAWQTYQDASVRLAGLAYAGGSIMPTIHNLTAIELAEQRNQHVESMTSHYEEP